jgi:hypothetical protein
MADALGGFEAFGERRDERDADEAGAGIDALGKCGRGSCPAARITL